MALSFGLLSAFARSIARAFQSAHLSWSLWLPVAYGTGVGIYFSLYQEPNLLPFILSCLFWLFMAFCYRQSGGMYFVLWLVVFLHLGILFPTLRTLSLQAPYITKSSDNITLTATIDKIELYKHAKRITFSNLYSDQLPLTQTPKHIRLHVATDSSTVTLGDTVTFNALLKPTPKPVTPHGYQLQRALYFKQIGAIGFATSNLTLVHKPHHSSPTHFIEQIRQTISTRLYAHMSPRYAANADALIIGNQTDIEQTDMDAMRLSGLAHLLAISGMHLVLVAFLFFYGSRLIFACSEYLTLNYPIKQWAAIIAMMGSFFYLCISGMPVSAIRAFIMTTVVLLAVCINRSANPMRSVAFAALLLLFLQPESLLSASFQMSFAAVIALISSFEWYVKHHSQPNEKPSWFERTYRYILMTLFSSIVAGLATAPFSIYHFHQVSNISVIANMVAIPLTSFLVMPLAVLGLLLMPLGLEKAAFIALDYGLSWLVDWAHFIASVPFASLQTVNLHATSFYILIYAGLWLCIWPNRLRLLSIPIALIALIINPYLLQLNEPDVIIDEKAKLVAFKNQDKQLLFLSQQTDNFITKQWQADYHVKNPNPDNPNSPTTDCDHYGCTYSKNQQQVTIITHPLGLYQSDCTAENSMVINLTNQSTHCPNERIDRWDLWRNGTHTLFIDDDTITVRHIRDAIGWREWNR